MSVFTLRRGGVPNYGISAGDISVGSSVYLMENGSAAEYLIVNQGVPSGSSLYDGSCDGTWLLRKGVYENRAWNSSKSDYANSSIHTYLNDAFLNLFDASTKARIKQVKIPYRKGTDSNTSVPSGESGLSTKIFLLSCYELGWTTNDVSNLSVEGAKLSYFESGNGTSANNKRLAKYANTTVSWWLRSAITGAVDGDCAVLVSASGAHLVSDRFNQYGIRPALVIPYTTKFDKDTLVLKG